MATPSRLDVSVSPRHESLAARLVRLIALELELGWAETRNLVIRVAVALAVAVPAAIALLASIVVLAAGALAPLLHTPWQHLVGAVRGRRGRVRRRLPAVAHADRTRGRHQRAGRANRIGRGHHARRRGPLRRGTPPPRPRGVM